VVLPQIRARPQHSIRYTFSHSTIRNGPPSYIFFHPRQGEPAITCKREWPVFFQIPVGGPLNLFCTVTRKRRLYLPLWSSPQRPHHRSARSPSDGRTLFFCTSAGLPTHRGFFLRFSPLAFPIMRLVFDWPPSLSRDASLGTRPGLFPFFGQDPLERCTLAIRAQVRRTCGLFSSPSVIEAPCFSANFPAPASPPVRSARWVDVFRPPRPLPLGWDCRNISP